MAARGRSAIPGNVEQIRRMGIDCADRTQSVITHGNGISLPRATSKTRSEGYDLLDSSLEERLSESSSLTNVVSTADTRDDWTQLRERGYGQDAVLRLCDVSNKARLAQHLICAAVHEQEIRELTGQTESENNSMMWFLRRHLRELKENRQYATAYYTENQFIDWYRVAQYFTTALEHRDEEMATNL
ncbi:hypothetical protein PHMEG_0006583 [Phytophthora megakarya]|uniref:Uncharacterized protein n=1 Tax=Phytophthora megakarya TaxID=4795 RepID=A0A225WQC9_9STRA|nr:hypothetical protein PHMEG_0006583 [Phytophthora megakarya]